MARQENVSKRQKVNTVRTRVTEALKTIEKNRNITSPELKRLRQIVGEKSKLLREATQKVRKNNK